MYQESGDRILESLKYMSGQLFQSISDQPVDKSDSQASTVASERNQVFAWGEAG